MTMSDTLPSQGNGRRLTLADRYAWLLALAAAGLPNLPFLLLTVFACPKRSGAIILYLLVALVALRLPAVATILLVITAVAFDIVQVIAGAFDLSPTMVMESARYAVAFDLFASPVYLVVVGSLVTTTALTAWVLVRFREPMRRASLVPAILCAAAVFAIDTSANVLPEKAFGAIYEAEVPFESAIGDAGIVKAAAAKDHNILLVVVEGMGAFADPAHQALLARMLDRPDLRQRYEVSEGTSSYVGSTTGAESRELCGRWGDFRDYLDGPHANCLPAQLARKGYETASFHAFSQDFFSRGAWYPHVGFEKSAFMEQLTKDGTHPDPRFCGLTFRGLCDLDVADRVEAYLDKTGEKPRFAYWLTLNTHMPIAREEGTPRLDCGTHDPFGDRMVCDMTEMWMDVLDRIATIATDPALPPTDIVVVGDHNPPLWTRHGRAQFQPGRVQWFALKAR